MSTLLSIDLGTSSVKLLRLSAEGKIISLDRVPCERLDVSAWMEILRENIAQHGDGASITRLAITGQMHGLLTLEKDGVWGEGIPWHDQRSTVMLPEIVQRIGDRAHLIMGGPIATGFQAASLAWLRRHDPARWSRILQVFLPKDALIHELTGRHVVDPSDAAGTGLFAPERGNWAWEIIGALRIPRPWLPDIVPSGSIAGRTTAEAASRLGIAAGTPVMITGGDAATGAYGAGVIQEGDALLLLSSGAQLLLPTDHWRPDAAGRWYTWPAAGSRESGRTPFLRAGTVLNAGIAMSWAQASLTDETISEEPTGLIALPHLIGTREDPAMRGAILGITPQTTPGEIRRAMLEGIAFTLRRKLEEMTQGGSPPQRVRIGGGMAHEAGWRQIFADVLGLPVQRVPQNDLSAYGAALIGAGMHPGDISSEALQHPETAFVGAYDELYRLFLMAEGAMAPLMTRLTHTRRTRP